MTFLVPVLDIFCQNLINEWKRNGAWFRPKSHLSLTSSPRETARPIEAEFWMNLGREGSPCILHDEPLPECVRTSLSELARTGRSRTWRGRIGKTDFCNFNFISFILSLSLSALILTETLISKRCWLGESLTFPFFFNYISFPIFPLKERCINPSHTDISI